MSFPTLTQASSPDFLEAHTRRKSPINLEASDPASSIPRNRMSWANRLRSSPLSFVSKLPPWGLQAKGGERDEEVEGPIESSHRSPSSPPPAYADIEVTGNEESTGDSMAFQETTCSESDHSESNTSVSPGVDTGKPLPKTPAISSQLLQSSHAENSLKDGIPVPMIKKNGPKLLLEMLMPAKSARFDEVVPFESFGELNSSMSYNASFRSYWPHFQCPSAEKGLNLSSASSAGSRRLSYPSLRLLARATLQQNMTTSFCSAQKTISPEKRLSRGNSQPLRALWRRTSFREQSFLFQSNFWDGERGISYVRFSFSFCVRHTYTYLISLWPSYEDQRHRRTHSNPLWTFSTDIVLARYQTFRTEPWIMSIGVRHQAIRTPAWIQAVLACEAIN